MAVFHASAADGDVRSSNATYLTARSSGTFSVNASGTDIIVAGQELFGGTYYCYEGFLSFDTSSIPADATITSATLRLWVASANGTSSSAAVVRVRVKDWGASVTSADWVAGASVSSQTLVAHFPALSGLTTGAYNTAIDDALAANITKAGTTYLMLHTDRFEAGTAPTGAPNGTEYATFSTADVAGTTQDPELTVEYTVSANAQPASATGASPAPGRTLGASAGGISATGWASVGIGIDLDLAASASTATGAAAQPVASVAPRPSAATATGSAHDPARTVYAEHIAATGTAHVAAASVRATTTAATATGAAPQPSPSIAQRAGLASSAASGGAWQPTIDVTSYVYAEHVAVTGSAAGATTSVAATAMAASATGAAADGQAVSQGTTVATVSPPILLTASAYTASIAVAFNAEVASAIGAAYDAGVGQSVDASAGPASATAEAYTAISPLASIRGGPKPRAGGVSRRPTFAAVSSRPSIVVAPDR